MLKNTGTFRLSMIQLSKLSPSAPRQGKYTKANASPSPPRSDCTDMTPLDLSIDDEENIPWIQRHCPRHHKVGISACCVVFLTLATIVAVVYFHIQPPPTGDMQQKHDWDNAETKTSIWPLVHNYQTIPTSSTLPIFTTEVVNFNSSIGPKVTTINLPSVIVDIMTNQTLQMKVSARTSGQVLKTPSNLSSQPQLSDTPWPISTTTSEYRQGSLLGGKLAPNRRHTTTYETMANANITVDETDSFKTSTPTNNTPLV